MLSFAVLHDRYVRVIRTADQDEGLSPADRNVLSLGLVQVIAKVGKDHIPLFDAAAIEGRAYIRLHERMLQHAHVDG
jgi:hypothetical protein